MDLAFSMEGEWKKNKNQNRAIKKNVPKKPQQISIKQTKPSQIWSVAADKEESVEAPSLSTY